LSWFYYIGRGIMRMLLALFTRWEVKGKENVPPQGGLLVVANHINMADPPLIGVSLGRKMLIMAKEELFRHRFPAYFVRRFGAFPVRRGRMDREALEEARRVLRQGLALVMFPEAKRSRNARLQRALPGSALLAARAGVPLLPVGITGTEHIKGWAWMLRRPLLTVNIGRPFRLAPANGTLTKEELAALTENIMEHIAALLPPSYRGIYGETGREDRKD
jgi:1-acyl-sn-glycerol-3-phosphate acyltransferase